MVDEKYRELERKNKELEEKIEKINTIVLVASDKKLEQTFQYVSGIKLDYIKEIKKIIDNN